MTLLGTGASPGEAAEPGVSQVQELTLAGDFVAMAEVQEVETTAPRLAVITVDHAKPRRHRALAWLTGTSGRLVGAGGLAVPDDAAAYDVCRLDPARPVSVLLFLRPGGVYQAGVAKALALGPTLFAHAREDALPRVRICFDLFRNERAALVVPTLAGVTIFRAGAGPTAGYAVHAQLGVSADPHYQGTLMRDSGPGPAQRLSLRLDYPEVAAVPFSGSGRNDLCLTLGETLTCYLQDDHGFAPASARRFYFDLLTDAERNDPSVHVDSRLVALHGDGKPDLVLKKATWSVADMGATLYVFLQDAAGGFSGKPSQTITRKGYFAFQEFLNLGGGASQPDMVAPVAALGWSDIVRIYLAKTVSIDFVAYRNLGGHFAAVPRRLHSLSYPVAFKNLGAILGALPLWDVRLLPPRAGRSERQVAFFPDREAVEVYALTAADEELRWRQPVHVGSEILVTSLGARGLNELVFAYPREATFSDKLVFVPPPGE